MRNVSFYLLQRVTLFFKDMPNSIDFYKRIFLHVIPVRIIVPWFQFDSCSRFGCFRSLLAHSSFFRSFQVVSCSFQVVSSKVVSGRSRSYRVLVSTSFSILLRRFSFFSWVLSISFTHAFKAFENKLILLMYEIFLEE